MDGQRLFEMSVELINRYNEVARQRRDYGTGVALSVSEAHLVEVVGNAGSLTSTEISRTMGVTKGAVSQMLPRLLRCGIVARTPSPTDGRASLVTLTDLGRQAFEGHKAVHEGLRGAFEQAAESMPERSREDIARLVESISAFLDTLASASDRGSGASQDRTFAITEKETSS